MTKAAKLDLAQALPENTLLNRRAKLYTKAALEPALQAFKDRFKLHTAEGVVAFNSTSVRIDLSSLPDKLIDTQKDEKPVRGIHISFGVSGKDFHPVVQFMFANDEKKGDLELFTQLYQVNNNKLILIDQPTADGFTSAYGNMICIDRTATGILDVMDRNAVSADPRAEWFPYPDNVNKLIADNIEQQQRGEGAPAVKYLVVSCISEVLDYGAMALHGVGPEYRHLLALYTATDIGDLLGAASIPSSGSYAGLAMDFGHLCPPRCKK